MNITQLYRENEHMDLLAYPDAKLPSERTNISLQYF